MTLRHSLLLLAGALVGAAALAQARGATREEVLPGSTVDRSGPVAAYSQHLGFSRSRLSPLEHGRWKLVLDHDQFR